MSFDSLGLTAELVRAVTEHGYTIPTPIQEKAIPLILEGRDVLAGAQTGTGKTAGFTLPLLQRLQASRPAGGGRPIRALVLTPTRELAAQVAESVETYGKHTPQRCGVVFGGVSINPQITQLKRGVDILVATPGRLLDHAGQRTLDLSRVEILVLDEADRMLDMGFIHDIRKVIALMPAKRQNLLFSATYSDTIRQLADRLLDSPVEIEVARRNIATDLVEQVVHPVDRDRKRELLSHLIRTQDWRKVLVFTRTKHGANRLAQQLKQNRIKVLVATEVAARGLDIDQLPHVVNFELPHVAEDYIHRIGRTGRAGREGEAVSLVCVDERQLLAGIERLLKRSLPSQVIDGFAPDPSIRPEPIPNGGGGRGRKPQHAGRRGHGEPSRPRSGPPRGRGPGPAGPSGNRRRSGGGRPRSAR